MKKPVILTFVAYYLPGYKSGGPLRSVANMVETLGDEFDFRIVTQDRDKFDKKPYPNVKLNEWMKVGKANVFYSEKNKTFERFKNLLAVFPHDIMYLNSFFSPDFTIKPLLAYRVIRRRKCPVIVAPRGEFSPGALAIKKLKKKIYIQLSSSFGFYNDVIWQASSDHEANDIKCVLGNRAKKIKISPNIPCSVLAEKSSYSSLDSSSSVVKLVFLSRISPKKNLDFALKVLRQVRCSVKFTIYGEIDDSIFWKKCQKIASGLPKNIKVKYQGSVEHSQVLEIISKNDIFFLPTHGENYGHAIVESLASGVPVLISDKTPWLDLDKKGVGWVRSLDSERNFVDVIEQFAGTDPYARCVQRNRARKYASDISSNIQIAEDNRKLFWDVLSGCSRDGLT